MIAQIASNENCPNCGAVVNGPTCEYCGTAIYGFPAVDVDLRGPSYMRIRYWDGRMYQFKMYAKSMSIGYGRSPFEERSVKAEFAIVGDVEEFV